MNGSLQTVTHMSRSIAPMSAKLSPFIMWSLVTLFLWCMYYYTVASRTFIGEKITHSKKWETKKKLVYKCFWFEFLNKMLKGEGGILLFSYKVVEFFVDIIYESTFGGYEKVLGISKPEEKKFEFWHPLPYTGGDWFWGYFSLFLSHFKVCGVHILCYFFGYWTEYSISWPPNIF